MSKLTDSKIKSFTPTEKIQKQYDGGGLYIEIKPSGVKTFRLSFRIKENDGYKSRIYTIGQYPMTTLAQARKLALEAKVLIKKGIDPVSANKKDEPVKIQTFKLLANDFLARQEKKVSASRLKTLNGLYRNYILPKFGKKEIDKISRNDIMKFAIELEKLGKPSIPESVLTAIKMVIDYALDIGVLDYNPYSSNIKKHLTPHYAKNHPHVSIDDLPKLLADIETTTSSPIVLCGLKLVILLFCRAGEIRFAKWEHVDFKNKLLTIPSENMKGVLSAKKSGRLEREIALSTQAISVLKTLKTYTGNKTYLLHSNTKSGVISDSTMNKILNNLGYKYKQDIHGFRGLASTYLNEHYPDKHRIIEKCLAHKSGDDVSLAYDHSKQLNSKREIWQIWGDFLEKSGLILNEDTQFFEKEKKIERLYL